ncbi:phosphate starvation-inducible PhoH-like protein [Rhizobium rosettiformans]|uniref:PhoH-like protein n=2 Tax=Rhizobium rosettiformans TaxID=1368430 RepID=A0A4S8PPJ0_9HYPH|nr:PhoH family protein [Rhizobium rosettiformans]MBB5277779.1 phosphate starvation-inducible PhoH-like protein [Rhizobium rosettiformans]THV32940.1 PhoH family protein [Rhizobium rosettiformans W3]
MNVHSQIFEADRPASNELDKFLTRRERKQLRKKGGRNPAPRMDIKEGYKPLVAMTPTQADYIDSLTNASQVFAIGPAGTGKTYIPARIAARMLKQKQIEKIYIARPTVSAKRHQQGFLPGKLEQKLAPWVVPIFDAIKDEVNPKTLEDWQKNGQIEIVSFEHLRGRTLRDCFVILDEAQLCTYADLKLFLTRKGESSTYVITGDLDQTEDEVIPDSGLGIVVDMIERFDLSPDLIEFDESEVVRSADAKEWVTAFKRASQG